MTPTLQPGQEVVATGSRSPRPGDLVVFEHPARGGFWLIKRLANDDGYVVSDNPDLGVDDSRTFGALSVEAMEVVVAQFDEATFAEACRLLAAEDESLARALDKHGVPEFWHRAPGLPTLAWLILEQQVSLESGAAMYRRLDTATGGVTAESMLGLGVEGMRNIGITRQKAGYLFEIARRTTAGDLDIAGFEADRWLEARGSLLSLRGVGPWTADAYLLSALRVPDIWPIGDRALQVGTAEVLGIGTPPDEDQLEILGEAWRPVRSAAARIIWHAYLSERDRVEPSDPRVAHGPHATA